MLKRSGISIAGKECVIVGRSNIVGKPMALLMLQENATVTIAHSKTENLAQVTKRADILIIAVGQTKMITKEYVKEGAVVIDVGMDRDENGKLFGDVDYEDVFSKVEAITPVPVSYTHLDVYKRQCVSFMFDKKGQIVVAKEDFEMDADELMMLALDAGADDFAEEEDSFEILTDPEAFSDVRLKLEEAGIPMAVAEVTMIPQTYVELTDETDLKMCIRDSNSTIFSTENCSCT